MDYEDCKLDPFDLANGFKPSPKEFVFKKFLGVLVSSMNSNAQQYNNFMYKSTQWA